MSVYDPHMSGTDGRSGDTSSGSGPDAPATGTEEVTQQGGTVGGRQDNSVSVKVRTGEHHDRKTEDTHMEPTKEGVSKKHDTTTSDGAGKPAPTRSRKPLSDAQRQQRADALRERKREQDDLKELLRAYREEKERVGRASTTTTTGEEQHGGTQSDDGQSANDAGALDREQTEQSVSDGGSGRGREGADAQHTQATRGEGDMVPKGVPSGVAASGLVQLSRIGRKRPWLSGDSAALAQRAVERLNTKRIRLAQPTSRGIQSSVFL